MFISKEVELSMPRTRSFICRYHLTMRPLIVFGVVLLNALCLRSQVAASPVGVPTQFDKSTVQNLLEKIDENQNAQILKMQYFAHRSKQVLPLDEGFALLKQALDHETLGSKKWFLLQSVRAFAGFRLSGSPQLEAYQSYGDIFSRIEDANKVGATDVVQSDLYEFFATLMMAGSRLQNNGVVVQNTLMQAFHAYMASNDDRLLSLPINEILAETSVYKDAVDEVDRMVADPQVTKTYRLLTVAAMLHMAAAPKQSVQLLRQAKPLLPGRDANIVRPYYKRLVDALEATADIRGAISAQEELVKLTDQGRARLIKLYHEDKDDRSVAATISSLSTPDANEQDINDAAVVLMGLTDVADRHKVWDQAAELLTQYLATHTKRDVEQELVARMLLGQILINHKKYAEARTALTVDQLQPLLKTRLAQLRYKAIVRMLSQVNDIQSKEKTQ
jgi:hypothetical protein